METLGEFLVHAITLEDESAQRFDELADVMEVHHNTEVAGLFKRMAHYSRLHLEDIRKQAEGMTLPHISPWDLKWPNDEAPETVAHEEGHYLMTAYHALRAALRSERTGHAFYANVARETNDPEIRKLASEFAAEEGEHIALLEKWLLKYPPPREGWDDDLDPPAVVD